MKDFIKELERLGIGVIKVDDHYKKIKRRIKVHAICIFLFFGGFLGYFVHITNNFMR